MTRKCYNHRPYTNLWHHKEQTQNSDNHKSTIQVKSQSSLPPSDYCKTRKDNKYYISKQGPNSKFPQRERNVHVQTSTEPPPWGTAADDTGGT